MNKALPFVTFVIGAAVSSLATWQLLKNKYEQIAQEEIDSVKEAFSAKSQSEDEKKSTKEPEEYTHVDEDIADYTKKVSDLGYTNYSKAVNDISHPYVISPEEFDTIDGYEVISLCYYADHILVDDNNEVIEDVEDVVGFESLGTFGQYEDDSVFVRNDRYKCDYEILADERKYSDVRKIPSHPMEV